MIKQLYIKIVDFEKLTNIATDIINSNNKNIKIKNYISNSIQIAIAMISKILTRGSGNNIDITDLDINKNNSSYQKAMDYFFHTDMIGIFYKYMNIANDRICNDSYNKMRTIKLNTFETKVLHYDMDDELKTRLMYEGYSKTIKYFINLLHIMEMTKKSRTKDEYLESYELRFKKMI